MSQGECGEVYKDLGTPADKLSSAWYPTRTRLFSFSFFFSPIKLQYDTLPSLSVFTLVLVENLTRDYVVSIDK